VSVVAHPDPHGAHVHDTWYRSYLMAALRDVRPDLAELTRAGHRAMRDELLSRCYVRAVLDGDHPEYVHGYAVWEVIDNTLVMHWVYVRSMSRRSGVGYALLRDAMEHDGGITSVGYTHKTWFSGWCEKNKIVYMRAQVAK
jgi:GNAT superfamily N-acetyltransferase